MVRGATYLISLRSLENFRGVGDYAKAKMKMNTLGSEHIQHCHFWGYTWCESNSVGTMDASGPIQTDFILKFMRKVTFK